jgi:hypothetical protein
MHASPVEKRLEERTARYELWFPTEIDNRREKKGKNEVGMKRIRRVREKGLQDMTSRQ